MQLIELTSADRDHFNRFVAEHETGSFLQSWEWGAWQEAQGKKVSRWFVLEGEKPVACFQFVRMPLPGKKAYLYSPYGPVVADEEGFRLLIADFRTIFNGLAAKFPNTVFVRIEPKILPHPSFLNPQFSKTVNIQPGKTLVADLRKPMDQLLSEMHPKTRYNIKVAQKHGVEVQREFEIRPGGGLYVKEALELIVQTATRQRYLTHPYSYYEKLLSFFQLHHRGQLQASLYKSVYQGRLLATAVMIDFGKTRTYLFGGSSTEHRNVMAPYLLHYQAMCDAQNKGMAEYDFDGLETSAGNQAEFARFKRGFGGREVTYAGAYDFVRKPLWYTVYKVMRGVNRAVRHIF